MEFTHAGYPTTDIAFFFNDGKDSELPFEYMMNRLRLYSSFTLDDYQQATGLEVESVLPTLELAKKKQFMEQRNGSWQVSQHGHRYLNDLLEMFL